MGYRDGLARPMTQWKPRRHCIVVCVVIIVIISCQFSLTNKVTLSLQADWVLNIVPSSITWPDPSRPAINTQPTIPGIFSCSAQPAEMETKFRGRWDRGEIVQLSSPSGLLHHHSSPLPSSGQTTTGILFFSIFLFCNCQLAGNKGMRETGDHRVILLFLYH